tara:strand:+ start:201 stop:551 length:351 start_codon:yes stop_codon:yes gene_type:complete
VLIFTLKEIKMLTPHNSKMKRFQFPKNKLARLALNVAFVPLWAKFLTSVFWPIFWKLILSFDDRAPILFPDLYGFSVNQYLLYPLNIFLLCIPIIFITRYLWWGCIGLWPRIPQSK